MKRNLLIIAHGSRSEQWNAAIGDFVQELRSRLSGHADFNTIEHCYLELAQPSISESLLRFAAAGDHACLIALPLFLSVSEHVLHDIPQEVEGVAHKVEEREIYSLYEINGQKIYLLDPPPHLFCWRNSARRFRRNAVSSRSTSLILVYYGTGDIWIPGATGTESA